MAAVLSLMFEHWFLTTVWLSMVISGMVSLGKVVTKSRKHREELEALRLHILRSKIDFENRT